MPLILAVEPDRRQGARIASLARDRLNVELVVTESVKRALEALDKRIPDLVLTSLMLSGKDEAALDERLRQLDAGGSHVQTLTIPVLASSGRRAAKRDGLLNRLRRTKNAPAAEPEGCDPAVFAAQIAEYLDRAADDRAALAVIAEDNRARHSSEPEPLPEPVAEKSVLTSTPTAPAGDDFAFRQAFTASSVSEIPPLTDLLEERRLYEPEHTPAEPDIVEALARAIAESPDLREPPIAPIVEPLNVSAPLPVLDDPDLTEEVTAAFEEFVAFDELSIVDVPSVSFGEFASAVDGPSVLGTASYSKSQKMDDLDAQAVEFAAFVDEPRKSHRSTRLDAATIIDALELLAEPEIPAAIELESRKRKEQGEVEPDPTAANFEFKSDLWMPLPIALHRRWPPLEGPSVRARFTPRFDAPPDPGVEFAAPPTPSTGERTSLQKAANGGKPFQDEWGFFDPVQCGFAALLAKLDEVTDKEDSPSETKSAR